MQASTLIVGLSLPASSALNRITHDDDDDDDDAEQMSVE